MTIVELLLIFTANAMASVHCAAMCGGFTLSLVRPGQTGASLVRMATYHTGKLFTYIFIGAIAGLAGAALLNNPAIRAAQVAFSVTAGVLIVVVGLQTLGLVPGQNLVNRIAARLWLGAFPCPFFKTLREQAAWQPLRPALARAAGVLVIALGVLTVVRGTPLVTTFAASGGHASHGPATVTTGAATSTGIDLDPAPAPHFSLINQDGQRVSLHDYHGKVVVLDFIYTSSSTTCPLLTATFQAAQDNLGADFGRTAA